MDHNDDGMSWYNDVWWWWIIVMDDHGGWWIVSIHYSFLLQEKMFKVTQLRKKINGNITK